MHNKTFFAYLFKGSELKIHDQPLLQAIIKLCKTNPGCTLKDMLDKEKGRKQVDKGIKALFAYLNKDARSVFKNEGAMPQYFTRQLAKPVNGSKTAVVCYFMTPFITAEDTDNGLQVYPMDDLVPPPPLPYDDAMKEDFCQTISESKCYEEVDMDCLPISTSAIEEETTAYTTTNENIATNENTATDANVIVAIVAVTTGFVVLPAIAICLWKSKKAQRFGSWLGRPFTRCYRCCRRSYAPAATEGGDPQDMELQ